MATWTAVDHPAEASLERTFGGTFAALAANPLAAFGITAGLSALPSGAFQYALSRYFAGEYGVLGRGQALAVLILSGLLALVLWALAQGALVQVAAAHREGRRAGLGEALETGLRALLPMIGRTPLATVATACAALVFVLPAILLYTVWAVSIPALVLEGLSPTDALERSQVLTRGARWRVLAFQLLILGGGWALGLLPFRLAAGAGAASSALLLCTSTLVGIIVGAVSMIAHAILYLELRDWKEGPPASHLAEVFR